MIARDLIKDTIPPLKTSDTGLKALSWMDEFRVSHLPIVNATTFLGLISEEDILNLNAPEQPLGNHSLSLSQPFIGESRHVYEAIKLIARLKIDVLPVLDEDQQYLGLITLPDLVQSLASIMAIEGSGSVVVLELNTRDYSLSEIAHIVEADDAKILSSYLTSSPDSAKLELTININKLEISRILASLARYDYKVIASYQESEYSRDLQTRFDALMNYLKI